MFLQIHTLTTYSASLLNRDDAGLAKRIPFGNATRLRVSSQCLKRHWREDLTQRLPDVPDSLRTRSFFTRTVHPRAVQAGLDENTASKLVEILAKAVVDGGVKDGGDLNQPVLFGLKEADYFVQMLVHANKEPDAAKALSERLKSKDEKENIKAMSRSAAGLTAALFGRMVTSDMLSRVDAPVHVAHAFTVHAANTEIDYFTVVDDLNRDDETGAAHANQSELGAGVYYGYVAIDIPLLVSNLTGCDPSAWRAQDPALARRVIEGLILSIAQQSPGAKKGSTAPYAWADMVMLEAGPGQPRSLANAFLDAVPTRDARQDLRVLAASRLADYMGRLDGMYGNGQDGFRGFSTILDIAAPTLPAATPLANTITGALDAIWA